MGRVYKASDTVEGEVVAINVLAPSLQDTVSVARFHKCIRRAIERGRALDRNPVLAICLLPGVTSVVVAYTEEFGAALDVAAQ